MDLLFASLKGGYDGSPEDLKGWFPKQTECLGLDTRPPPARPASRQYLPCLRLLLDRLVDHAREQALLGTTEELRGRLDVWNEAFGFDGTKNAELRFRWLILALVLGDSSRVDKAIEMAQEAPKATRLWPCEVGRMKFTRPLYRELCLVYRHHLQRWAKDQGPGPRGEGKRGLREGQGVVPSDARTIRPVELYLASRWRGDVHKTLYSR